MITLTEKAVTKVKELSESEGIGHCNIRTKILGGGCSGYQFDLMFDDQISDSDEVLEQDGIKVVVDMLSYQYIDGITIDYIDNVVGGGGFKFFGGDIKGTCGCGSSVAF